MNNDQAAAHKGSLHRLGSIANMTFNPFNRRKANMISDGNTFTSNQRLLSMPSLPSDTSSCNPSSTSVRPGKPPTALPKSTFSDRRHSYIPLPEEPCGHLLRSRTLSNLPVPVKVKAPSSAPKSKSTAMLPQSRTPTPPKSEVRARLVSNAKSIMKPSKAIGMLRSDTQPLLSDNGPGTPPTPTSSGSTTLKENLRLSPIRHLPQIQIFEDTTATPLHLTRSKKSSWLAETHEPTPNTQVDVLKSSQKNVKPSLQSARNRKPSTNSPSTPQRSSHSVLMDLSHNVRAKRVSYGAGIKQHHLLTPRQPPTPQPPVTPSKRASPSNDPFYGSESSKSLLGNHEQNLCSETSTPSPPSHDPDKVTACEPAEYWCGRMSVLTDRYRNERFSRSMELGQPAKLENEAETHDRIRRAMQHLYSVCASEEAKASFKVSEDRLLEFLHLPLTFASRCEDGHEHTPMNDENAPAFI